MKEKSFIVYLIKYQGNVMYVGKTSRFTERCKEHLRQGDTSSIPKWINTNDIEITPVSEYGIEDDALRCEGELIVKYNTINNGWNVYGSGLKCRDNHSLWRKEWNQSEHRQEIIHNYRQKPEYKEYLKEYQHTPQRKEYQCKYHRKYRESEKYKQYYLSHKDEWNAKAREKYRLKKLEKSGTNC